MFCLFLCNSAETSRDSLSAGRRVSITGTVSDAAATGLLPGWERRVTPAGKPYYVNHLTRTTQWEPPTASGAV